MLVCRRASTSLFLFSHSRVLLSLLFPGIVNIFRWKHWGNSLLSHSTWVCKTYRGSHHRQHIPVYGNPLWSMLQSLDIDAPGDLKARDVTTDSSVLTWIPPLADIDGYILTYRDEDGNMEVFWRWSVAFTHGVTTAVFSSLWVSF